MTLVIKMLYKIICSLAIMVSVGTTSVERDNQPYSEELNISIPDSVNKLMIVAHPDDETIWGGRHLLDDSFFIVCITNGNNEIRKKEFEKMLQETKSSGVILSYPDKTNGKRDNWERSYSHIQYDIYTLLNKKDWEMIVTHNPDGEYGHIHHKMTSEIVSSLCELKHITSKLNYFGIYYKKDNLPNIDTMNPIRDERLREKQDIIDIYQSQNKVMNTLHHMFPFENWIPYAQWEQKKR